jgi:integrase
VAPCSTLRSDPDSQGRLADNGLNGIPGTFPTPFTELDGLRPYDLRHLHASLLLARGVSLRTVSERLGHADPGFTLSTYTHLVPGTQEAAAKAISEELFGKRSRVQGM